MLVLACFLGKIRYFAEIIYIFHKIGGSLIAADETLCFYFPLSL